MVDSFADVKDDILKFTICDFIGAENNSNKFIFPEYGNELKITVSGQVWLDIVNKDINKGIAIKVLQDRFNITPKETMVFGDYFNDIEMFDSAYYSYAMDNAHKEVKKHARFIAKSNEEGGVIEVIREKVLS